MSENTLDAMALRAGEAMSRRTSLLAVAAATLTAAIAAPVPARAGTVGRRARRQSRRRCQRQVDQCRAALTQICEGIEGCFDISCCDRFAGCQGTEALHCIFTSV